MMLIAVVMIQPVNQPNVEFLAAAEARQVGALDEVFDDGCHDCP
jgi:hypothetical protein